MQNSECVLSWKMSTENKENRWAVGLLCITACFGGKRIEISGKDVQAYRLCNRFIVRLCGQLEQFVDIFADNSNTCLVAITACKLFWIRSEHNIKQFVAYSKGGHTVIYLLRAQSHHRRPDLLADSVSLRSTTITIGTRFCRALCCRGPPCSTAVFCRVLHSELRIVVHRCSNRDHWPVR